MFGSITSAGQFGGMSERLGYIRVSSSDQNTARQLEDIQLDQKFVNTVSRKNTNRPELINLLRFARKGDTVLVNSLDAPTPAVWAAAALLPRSLTAALGTTRPEAAPRPDPPPDSTRKTRIKTHPPCQHGCAAHSSESGGHRLTRGRSRYFSAQHSPQLQTPGHLNSATARYSGTPR